MVAVIVKPLLLGSSVTVEGEETEAEVEEKERYCRLCILCHPLAFAIYFFFSFEYCFLKN